MRRIGTFLLRLAIGLFSLTILLTLIFRFLNPPVTPLMLIRLSEQAEAGKEIRLKKDWTRLEDFSPEVVRAVLAAEDNRFLYHWGFELSAIRAAFRHNEKARIIRGASTISQQTAKNVFLWPARSWIRKGLEAYFTMLIEVFWGKERIMEVYLNVVEQGDGIYGIAEAGKQYFGKQPGTLSRKEAALLAGILPGPLLWNPAKPSPRMFKRQQIVMRNMKHIPSPVW